MLPMPTEWWLRPVSRACRVGAHSAVVWNRLYRNPPSASRSAVGIRQGPPNVLDAPKPTSSSRTTRTLGAPSGGSSGSIGGNAVSGSLASYVVSPWGGRSGMGSIVRAWRSGDAVMGDPPFGIGGDYLIFRRIGPLALTRQGWLRPSCVLPAGAIAGSSARISWAPSATLAGAPHDVASVQDAGLDPRKGESSWRVGPSRTGRQPPVDVRARCPRSMSGGTRWFHTAWPTAPRSAHAQGR